MADRDGFDEFVATHAVALARSARLLTGEPGSADDLLQETLIRLWTKWPRVRGADRPLAYARTTMARLHLDSRRLRRSHETPIAIDDRTGEHSSPTSVVDDHLTLWQALDRLQRLDRAVLVLRYHDGYTSGEVAAMLGISDGAVRKRAARALQVVRTELDSSKGVR
ncbi:SigE family RNA polymerase sigma factor [Calidifontibacter indicus]|uniref:RNA polymerase sigma-70 factor (Sigma-E family) n=1 Tax=Calidifontibacter indicus TaxID=419650 RepID=A0A3D9UQG9_9MICO|nr:SigE family RNA polymerase sigma factor [Calidifontibacter indicus]REF31557.1 RNA polymerase sigma-70 factor (sigma-E family) [Calidifontibacter indicus]